MTAALILAVLAFLPDDNPTAYVLPPSAHTLVGKLQDAGARVEELREDLEVDARTPGGAAKPTNLSARSFILRAGQSVDPRAKELIDAFAKELRGGSQEQDVLELVSPTPLH